jgi:hypothetical protein
MLKHRETVDKRVSATTLTGWLDYLRHTILNHPAPKINANEQAIRAYAEESTTLFSIG